MRLNNFTDGQTDEEWIERNRQARVLRLVMLLIMTLLLMDGEGEIDNNNKHQINKQKTPINTDNSQDGNLVRKVRGERERRNVKGRELSWGDKTKAQSRRQYSTNTQPH